MLESGNKENGMVEGRCSIEEVIDTQVISDLTVKMEKVLSFPKMGLNMWVAGKWIKKMVKVK